MTVCHVIRLIVMNSRQDKRYPKESATTKNELIKPLHGALGISRTGAGGRSGIYWVNKNVNSYLPLCNNLLVRPLALLV